MYHANFMVNEKTVLKEIYDSFTEEKMQVTVDKVLCIGSGNCATIAPNIFEMGEDAKSHVKVSRVPEDKQKTVREAVKQCPAMAISVLGSESGK